MATRSISDYRFTVTEPTSGQHEDGSGMALGMALGVFFGVLVPIAQIPLAAGAAIIVHSCPQPSRPQAPTRAGSIRSHGGCSASARR